MFKLLILNVRRPFVEMFTTIDMLLACHNGVILLFDAQKASSKRWKPDPLDT